MELKAKLDTFEPSIKRDAPVLREVAAHLDPVWLATGRPKPPVPSGDRDLSERQSRIFDEQEKEHDAFVARVRARLLDTPSLRAVFVKVMRDAGYAELVRIHFPNPVDVTRRTLNPKRVEPLVNWDEFPVLFQATAGTLVSPSLTMADKVDVQSTTEEAQVVAAPVLTREEARAAELRRFAKDRAIPHLVDFTQCANLPSMLQHGVRSVAECSVRGISARRNDTQRLDGAMDGISLSISFPNYRMFYKYRQLDLAIDWVVLILSPQILWTKPCSFFRMNAADHRMRDRPRDETATQEAFQEMFASEGTARPDWLLPCDPTDPQAEAMVHDVIEPRLIDRVVFESDQSHDRWAPSLKGIRTTVTAPGRALFATRQNARAKA